MAVARRVIPWIVVRLDDNRLVVMVVEVTVFVMVVFVVMMAMVMVLVMMTTTVSTRHTDAAQHQDRRDHCQRQNSGYQTFHGMPPRHEVTALEIRSS